MDIITTVFRVVRNYDMHELVKLEFIKVKASPSLPSAPTAINGLMRCYSSQHMFYRQCATCMLLNTDYMACTYERAAFLRNSLHNSVLSTAI